MLLRAKNGPVIQKPECLLQNKTMDVACKVVVTSALSLLSKCL